MKIPNTICGLESQRNLLERHPKRHAAITPHILCISVLALLTGCNATLELKPDKAPGGTTGNNRPIPPYPSPIGPVYPGQVYPGQVYPGQVYPGQVYPGQVYPGQVYPGPVYPGQVYPGPFTSTDGGYGPGISRLAIQVATVRQVVALLSSLHLAEGERQSYQPAVSERNLLAPALEEVNYEPYKYKL